MPTLPSMAIAPRNDFAALQGVLYEAQLGTPLSYELLVAQSLQESSWKIRAFRYEPNFDRRYISGKASRWSKDPAWMGPGNPTVAHWFLAHPGRINEKSTGLNYDFVAQTRIASSYGPFQLMYPVATELGYVGTPEALVEPGVNVALGTKLLLAHYWNAREKWPHRSSLMIALARYNGGAVGNTDPTRLRNIQYVKHINHRFQQCWGRSLFPGI